MALPLLNWAEWVCFGAPGVWAATACQSEASGLPEYGIQLNWAGQADQMHQAGSR